MCGIYIHIPFCIKKCKYCDFVSYVNERERIEEYIEALKVEMKKNKWGSADTVFIGGGTPTMLDGEKLQTLISAVYENFDISANAEFTVEANPGTLTNEKLHVLLESGVNRVSIGVQSFEDRELRAIGRIHTAQEAYDTILAAHKIGFKNINVDLMTALPFQTAQTALNSLKTAVQLPVTHISAYSLIVEDNTPIAREIESGKLVIADEDSDRDIYAQNVAFLKNNGFEKYEISNFAKEGFECRHNIKYWECRKYIGIGAAAHGYDGEVRYSNSCGLDEYIHQNKREYIKLSKNDKISEFMMMGLRMTKGIDENEFRQRFGLDIKDIFARELEYFEKVGALEHKNGRYFLTDYGMDVSNSVMCEFMI